MSNTYHHCFHKIICCLQMERKMILSKTLSINCFSIKNFLLSIQKITLRMRQLKTSCNKWENMHKGIHAFGQPILLLSWHIIWCCINRIALNVRTVTQRTFYSGHQFSHKCAFVKEVILHDWNVVLAISAKSQEAFVLHFHCVQDILIYAK